MQVGFKIYNDVDNGDDDYDDKGDSCKSYSSSVYGADYDVSCRS